MNRPRPSMARLMVIVGIVALNIAALRALFFSRIELALGLMPFGIVLQAGLIKAIRNGGRSRCFWAGFTIVGVASAASFVWAAFFEKSWLGVGWNSYTFTANAFLRAYAPGLGLSMFSPNKWSVIATVAIICFAPQVAAAAIGGLSGLLIAGRRSRKLGGPEAGTSIPASPEGRSGSGRGGVR